MTTKSDDQSNSNYYFIGIDDKGKGRFHAIALLMGLAETIQETIVPQPTWMDVIAQLDELGEESIGIYPSDVLIELKQKRNRETPDAVRQCAAKATKSFANRIGETLQPILHKLLIDCAKDALQESPHYSKKAKRNFKRVIRDKYGKHLRGRPDGSKSKKDEQALIRIQGKQLNDIRDAIRQLNQQEMRVTQESVADSLKIKPRQLRNRIKSLNLEWKDLVITTGR